MKPSLLQQHLKAVHTEFQEKPKSFFERKLEELSKMKKKVTSFSSVNQKAVEASYRVSLRIYVKNKYRNRLQVADDLRLGSSNLEPNFHSLIACKQAQGSH